MVPIGASIRATARSLLAMTIISLATEFSVQKPGALPDDLIHGCGGACSSGDDTPAQPAAVA